MAEYHATLKSNHRGMEDYFPLYPDGFYFRTEDDGEIGPFASMLEAEEAFDRYCQEWGLTPLSER